MNRLLMFPLLLSLLVAGALVSLALGAVPLSPAEVWQGLWGGADHFTIQEYRLPRLLLALLVGSMSAVAGVMVQGVIRNPLASPDVLGISHGAGLAAVVLLTLLPGLSLWLLPWIALTGGLLAALLLWLVCAHRTAPVKLALCGVALSALYASITDFLLLTRPVEINAALLWLTGSLWGRGWPQLFGILPWLSLLPLVLWLCQRLNLAGLGEEQATTLGERVGRVRLLALLVAVCWSAATVAICGPIAFIGLVSPHLARALVGGCHQRLLPMAMLVGALLLLLADLAGRILAPPLELPAGIMTALLGAPYFLYLLFKMRAA